MRKQIMFNMLPKANRAKSTSNVCPIAEVTLLYTAWRTEGEEFFTTCGGKNKCFGGWVGIHDDLSWRDIMVLMNDKLAIAKTLFPMEGWEDTPFRSKSRLAHRTARSPVGWPAKSVSWNPLTNWESNFACKPHRKRGRPSTRWDDILTIFFSEFFHNDNWWHVAREVSSWFTSQRFYVQFCRAHFGL